MSNTTYAILDKLLEQDLRKAPIELIKIIYNKSKIALQNRKNETNINTTELLEYEAANQKRFKGMPMVHEKFNAAWLWYLSELLEQDWSHLFNGNIERKYYVYFHKAGKRKIIFNHEKVSFDCTGYPFYVGKGTGDRAYDLNRNQGHGKILDQLKLQKKSSKDIVFIVKDCLTESEALELESKLIYFFGTKYEKNRRGILVNLDLPKIPDMQYETQIAKVRLRLKKQNIKSRGFID